MIHALALAAHAPALAPIIALAAGVLMLALDRRGRLDVFEMSTAIGQGEKTQASNGRRSAEITMNDASLD